MNKPIRCTTHFHACDCREYEFEQLRKENEELKKKFKNEEDCWLISMESRDEKIADLQKENEELKGALESINENLMLMLASYGDNTRTEKLIKDSLKIIKGEAK